MTRRITKKIAERLTGRWHCGHGVVCCGTLRIARSDFDTNPAPEFQSEVLQWICDTLNAAVDFA